METGAPIIPARDHRHLPSPAWSTAQGQARAARVLPPVIPQPSAQGDQLSELIDRLVWPAVREEYGRLQARPGLIAAGLAALGVSGGLPARRQLAAGSLPRLLGKVEPRKLRRREARRRLWRVCVSARRLRPP